MPEIRQRPQRKRRRKDGLLRFARDVKSQSGEDGVIAGIFEALDKANVPKSSPKAHRWCLDVGAWDGVHLSNTYALLVGDKRQRWRGVLIEADSDRYAQLAELHGPLGNVAVHALVSCVAGHKDSLSEIVKRVAPPEMTPADLDLVSIDVDGPDYWLMANVLEAAWRPLVFCCEFNPTIPHDVIFVQDRNDAIRQGSSLAALAEMASRHGYKLAETTTFNAFFVRQDCYEVLCRRGLCHPDDDIDELHDFSMGTQLYQLYDGTLKLAGCRKLLWHERALEEAKIQHLAKHDRVYPYSPPNPPNSLANGDSQKPCLSSKRRMCRRRHPRKARKHKHSLRTRGKLTAAAATLVAATCAVSFILVMRTSRRRLS